MALFSRKETGLCNKSDRQQIKKNTQRSNDGSQSKIMATGSPGGSRIITTTLQIIMNVIDHKMNIAEATNAVRVHHQWLPDELRIEKGLNQDTIKLLKAKGQNVVEKEAMGSTQSIMHTDKGFFGASDPRTPSALTVGY